MRVIPTGIVPVIILLMAAPLASSLADDDGAERQLIEKAVRNYIDGWYEGDADRVEQALHPDLVKRRVTYLPSGRGFLNTVSANAMIEYTRMGGGAEDRREGQLNEVTILDVSPHTASVKTVSHQYIDYIHLAKIDGRWQIVNVLWEMNNP